MSLSQALGNALTGLRINQQQLATLSQNIANANTVGYSRKQVEQKSNVIDGSGFGVKALDISRSVDAYLNRAVQQQTGLFSSADVISEFAARMQVLIGKPGSLGSLDSTTTGFFNTLQQLAESPESGSLKLSGVSVGIKLASQISQLASDVQGLRYQADQEIKQLTDSANTALRSLQGINVAISTAFNSGRSTAELEDQRDKLVTELGGYFDVSYFYDRSGAVNITSNSGVPLVSNGVRYELSYSPQASDQAFVADGTMNPVNVYLTDSLGKQIGGPTALVTGGKSSVVATSMTTGKLKGLLDIRDSKLPQVLDQLDNFASTIRDQFNILQNAGSAFPGSNSYTGTRAISPADFSEWSGKVRIGVVDANGNPVSSIFPDEASGTRPLTIDLSSLESAGYAPGKFTVQTLVSEINNNFQPQNKASLGDLNSIRLTSDSASIPTGAGQFAFDFDLENIAGGAADFFLTGLTVLDDTGTDITNIATQTIPQIALSAASTYTTTPGSTTVTITTALPHNLQNGDTIFLSDPLVPVDGIPSSELGGHYFTVNNVTGSTFQIQTTTPALAGGVTGVAGQEALPRYTQALPGDITRTKANGLTTVDLSLNLASQFYTVTAQVGVKNADGTLSVGTVSYKVLNPSTNVFNQRFGAQSGTGNVKVTTPNTTQPLVVAKMVDANGVELAKINGNYVPDATGYLQIKANNQDYYVSIDSLNSSQLGLPSDVPVAPGTNRGFSHYFELNNFFQSYKPTAIGDTVKGSAQALAVESRLVKNPNLISTGRLTQTARPSDPNKPPLYTYEMESGDNSAIQAMAGLGEKRINFAPAGGLGATGTDFNGYAGTILGFVSADAAASDANRSSIQIIKDGFSARAQSLSGVNLDEELANTIIYQNAYTASARVITVANELFGTLLDTFRG